MTVRDFYTSSKWRRARKAYTKAAGGLCERCKKKGLYEPGTTVHHIIRLNADNIDNPDITINFNNLELLCRNCHEEEHDRKKKPKNRRYRFDENGNIIF